MAKRFTDNEKWKDAWFMDLPSKYKLFWLYLLDECNHAGIWKVNFRVAIFHVGEHLEYSEVKRILKDRITVLSDEYWYIDKFIKYQYKCEIQGLSVKNKAHLSIIKILNEYDVFKPLTSPLLGVQDKDKEKEKDIINKIDVNSFYDIEILKKYYLENEKVVKAIINNKDNKLNSKEQLLKRLTEFNEHMKQQSRLAEKFTEYSKYFLNWNRKKKEIDDKKPKPVTYTNPYKKEGLL